MSASRALEERIRAALAVIVDTTPVGDDLDELRERVVAQPRPARPRPLGIFAAAFVSIALVGGVLLWLVREGPDPESVAQPDAVPVSEPSQDAGAAPEPAEAGEETGYVEARYDVTLAGECRATSPGFTSATVRVWGPGAAGSFRVELEYPDGSSEFLVTDSLVNVAPRRIWYENTGRQQIGDPLARSDCLGAGATSPDAVFERLVLVQAASLLSADNVVSIDGTTLADGLLAREPARVETLAGVPTNVYAFPGQRSQTVWLDPAARRVEQRITEITDAAGGTVLSETITVVERRRTRVDDAWFDTAELPLYSSTAGFEG